MTTTELSIKRRSFLKAGAAAGAAALASALTASTPARAAVRGIELPAATTEPTPFQIHVPQAQLDDLRSRLANVIWPNKEPVDDWSQGVPLASMRELTDYWRDHYDWRRVESRLNSLGQHRIEIDGLGIHFLHIRSKHANALPLLMTHGWPGSIVEFMKVIDPLTNPTAHGGRAEDAFHLVLPTLPGYGFSDKPTTTGWDDARVARTWNTLMVKLGYQRYVAQGGDWGACVTTALGQQQPKELAGIHLNWAFVFPKQIPTSGLLPDEEQAVRDVAQFREKEGSYYHQQATKPQTIGYALSDSPVGLAAWIYEKFHSWTDSGGKPERVLTRDEMLDDITLYWLTDTAASSARMYWENQGDLYAAGQVNVPAAVSVFPHEIFRAPERWTRDTFPQLVYFNKVEKGGHFAAFEQPEIFVRELRDGFRKMRA
ncbi:epoxide hydrolase family protein [Paraburkholderia fynbosensis]|uniref:Epoxide hydrolase N-terminal domain-containing protein n=1 Tax=Paraburkholderia fynbosensis TaxID=1200993 RepID=A0A6J5GV54_9BURK|nr:epoxide hydrolase family protein [Paraburkholderia fynbosensis]CAB3804282.1 hypothetical protein LMG27177_05608 [Paraburkholderia fynbosensis]